MQKSSPAKSGRTPPALRLIQDPRAVVRHRVLAGLRQKDLAQAADISPNHLCNIERGTRSPSVVVLHRLAEVLDCEPKALMARELIDQ